jgi:hypothetical protein
MWRRVERRLQEEKRVANLVFCNCKKTRRGGRQAHVPWVGAVVDGGAWLVSLDGGAWHRSLDGGEDLLVLRR